MSDPDDILATYEAVGPAWAEERSRALFERPALERLLAAMPGPRLLDVGCGSGDPLALWFADTGCEVTGSRRGPVDGGDLSQAPAGP